MSKSLNAELAKRIGRDRKSTELMLEALAHAIGRHCGELDCVAIPAFGKFGGVKHQEKIVRDLTSGGKLLLPPEIELTFTPAGKLRKLAEKKSE